MKEGEWGQRLKVGWIGHHIYIKLRATRLIFHGHIRNASLGSLLFTEEMQH